MSGEKAHRARVVSSEELHRRAVAAARARCESLQGQLTALASQIEGTTPSIRSTSMNDLGALQSAEAELYHAIRDARAALALQQSRTRLELVATKVEVAAVGQVALGIVDGSSTNTEQAKLARVLSRLSEIENPADLEELTDRLAQAARLQGPAQELALLEMDHEVAARVKQQRVRSRCVADAEVELLKIAHVEGELAESVRDHARAVTNQTALAALRAEVRDVLDEAERVANAIFISHQAALVMAEMGYVVDEPFDLIEQHGEGFFARRDDLPEHALQVSVDAMAGVLQTRVIAVAQTTVDEDVRAESATCEDALALVERLGAHGVQSETIFHRAAGELPVAAAPQTAPRKKKRARLKEMELNL